MLPFGHMGITFALVRILEKLIRLRRVDYRLLLAGAALPDLIDKPLGYLLSAGHLPGGRAMGHSLVFLLLLLGIILMQRRKKYETAKAETLLLGSAVHDLLDIMWRFPKTFFWPLGGWVYAARTYEAWDGTIRFGMIMVTKLLALEVIGGGILLYFFIRLALRNKISYFISTGKLTRGIRLKRSALVWRQK